MKAINELTKTIKRRIKMFYFAKSTTSQIATLEHCGASIDMQTRNLEEHGI